MKLSAFHETAFNSARRVYAAWLAVAVLGLTAAAPPAFGQTLDYGELEKLFGEPVTASATGKPQRIGDAPASMTIVTADQIRRSGATDIPDVLRQVAGVDVWRWSLAGADVAVRGYNQPYSPRLLVLINGRQVYADTYGYTPWNALPVELAEIRQIEIVRGPNSALYGFNAVGGVINIVTFDPLDDAVNAASATVGTQSYRGASVVTTQKAGDKAGLRVSLGGYNADDFSTPLTDRQRPFRRDPIRRSFSAAGAAKPDDRTRVDLEVTHTEAKESEFFPSWAYVDAGYHTSSAKGSVAIDSRLGLVKATAYTNWLDFDSTSATGGLDESNRVTVVSAEDLFSYGAASNFRVNAEYRHNEGDSTPLKGGNIHYDVYAVGGMWEYALSPQLTATNAVRVDMLQLGRSGALDPAVPFTNADYDRWLMEPSFNSSLVYKASPEDTLRLSAARGVQVPSLNESGLQVVARAPVPFPPFTLTNVFVGNPFLEPTVVYNYEISYDRRVAEIGGAARLSLFRQYTKSVKGTNQVGFDPANPVTIFANIGDSDAMGVELELTGRAAERWRWELSYAFLDVSDTFPFDPARPDRPVDFQDSTPEHVIKARIGTDFGPFEVDLAGQFVSGFQMLRSTGVSSYVLDRIESYAALGARVGYRISDSMTAAVSGQDLTQSSQHQTSGPDVERRILFTLGTSY